MFNQKIIVAPKEPRERIIPVHQTATATAFNDSYPPISTYLETDILHLLHLLIKFLSYAPLHCIARERKEGSGLRIAIATAMI